jgi:hypothetical protein
MESEAIANVLTACCPSGTVGFAWLYGVDSIHAC